MSTDRHKTHDEYGVLLMMFLNHAGYEAKDVEGIILSSVVPTINYTIEHMIDDYFGIVPLQVEPGIRTGINIRYDNPQALGADRICNAVAAQRYYGGPCIFIDFGTATSFGVISKKGEFLGGAICPGVKMSSEALTERAAQLPKVELVKPDSVIQRNTITNMQAGIVYGYVGQVDYIVRKMKAEIGAPLPSALAIAMMSGVTPKCSMANSLPVRAKPVWTSSMTSSVPCAARISLTRWKYPFGGTTMPALP